MAQMERREGSGVLFTNKDKTNPKGPDLQGELKLDQDYKAGHVIKLSGWIRQTSVAPLYSLVINNYKAGANKTEQQYPKVVNIDDGDVPF